jgi:uncharacterized protein
MYEAVGCADAAAILDSVTDDVDCAADTSPTGAPWYGVRHGNKEVGSFFPDFGLTMEIEEFTPLTSWANDDSVFTVLKCRPKSRTPVRSTGMNLHHCVRFTAAKVSYYRGTEDTAQTRAALHG